MAHSIKCGQNWLLGPYQGTEVEVAEIEVGVGVVDGVGDGVVDVDGDGVGVRGMAGVRVGVRVGGVAWAGVLIFDTVGTNQSCAVGCFRPSASTLFNTLRIFRKVGEGGARRHAISQPFEVS